MRKFLRIKNGGYSVRMRVLLPVGIALLLFMLVFIYVFYRNTNNLLSISEHEHIARQSDIVQGSIALELASIRSVTREWSSWVDTYLFALGENPSYTADNWESPDALRQHGLSFVVIKDLSGKDLYVLFYDYDTNQALPVPEGFTDFILPLTQDVLQDHQIKAMRPFDEEIGKNGFLSHGGTGYYICSLPILTSNEESAPAGTLSMGRIFDGDELMRIAGDSEARLTILNAALSVLPEDHSDTADETIIFAKLPGFDGYGDVMLKIEVQRTLYKNSIRAVRITAVALGVVLLLLVLVLFYLLDRNLLRPMRYLSKEVQSVVGDSVSIDIAKYAGNREFYAFAAAINDMLNRILLSRQKAEESAMSINVLTNILNGMDAYLYVTDPETDEILFINSKMNEHFGLNGEGIGKVCWQVLQSGFTQRCDFCPNHKLMKDPDTPVVWEEENTVTGHYYKNVDSIIQWSGGKNVHLQHSSDITDIKLSEASLKKRLDQQELMSEITKSFIDDDDEDAFINNALKKTGEFMNISRIMLAAYNDKDETLEFKYAWHKQETQTPVSFGAKLPFKQGTPMFDEFSENGYSVIAIDNTEHNHSFQHVKALGIKAFLTVPVFVFGDFWGVLEFDHCDMPVAWSESDVYLGNLIVNVLSGVISRQIMQEERVSAEEEIQRMSAIISSSPQYVAYMDRNGDYLFFNPAILDISGYSYEELMTGGSHILYDDETARRMVEQVIPEIFDKGSYVIEVPFIRKDGDVRTMSISAFTIESQEDYFGIIASDVTEKRQLENALIEAKELAEQASKAKGEFLSRMSHEMRTPMNAIIGMTNIAKKSNDSEKKDYCLGKIDNASKHLLGVINDVLDMSKIEANKFELSLAELDIEKMLINITNVVNFRVEEKKQNLIINLDKDVPATIISDELRLTQIITNLLTNAIKFTPDGGMVMLNINKISEADGVITLQIDVTDTGIGISEEQQSRLFNSFEQADGGIARKYGGTGLGLVISKRIVELMDGRIWIESELGCGSKFIFTMKAERGKTKHRTKLSADINKENIRILVVDDSVEIRDYFEHIMAEFGLPCDVAADGAEAVKLVNNCADKPYNIFFVDFQMPEMNGIELTRIIKTAIPNNVIIIMISVSEWSDIEDEAVAAGVDRFISKPLFSSVLINSINECLGVPKKRQISVENVSSQNIYSFKGHTILLAEDVDINREIIAASLDGTGIVIDYAENGLEAVDMFKKRPGIYSLILMDIHMPEMDGYEATRKIRSLTYERAGTIPIIAMTANVFREDIENCKLAGMNDHIGKPVDMDELFEKFKKYLPQKSADADTESAATATTFSVQNALDYSTFLPVVDVDASIKRLANENLYFKLLRNFKCRQMTDALAKNIADGNLPEAALSAHAMKGAAVNLGLTELGGVVSEIEQKAKAGEDVSRLADTLLAAASRTIDAINILITGD